jgi:hypothetical protein
MNKNLPIKVVEGALSDKSGHSQQFTQLSVKLNRSVSYFTNLRFARGHNERF